MSISKSGGPETHVFQILIKEDINHSAEWVNDIALELGLQGRAAIEGRIIYLMLNARTAEIEYLLDKLLTILGRAARASLISRERLPFVHLSGFSMIRGSSTLPIRERHATDGHNICLDCRAEIKDPEARRFGYPFTECPACAPAFHERNAERDAVVVSDLTCIHCREEATDPTNKRYLFGEISCPECGPTLFWQRKDEARWQLPLRETLLQATSLIREGGIIAIKGNGGYHLACDASNEKSILDLRKRKGNLLKPLAVMYPDLSDAAVELEINEQHAAALLSSTGSIVVCPFRNLTDRPRIARTSLAGILDRQGVMLPHSPLMQVLSSMFDGPLAVTSANLSGRPLIHRTEARNELWAFADAIIDHDRQILMPTEEPVIQFTDAGERILLRGADHGLSGQSVDWSNISHGNALAMSCTQRLYVGSLMDGIFRKIMPSSDPELNQAGKNSHTKSHYPEDLCPKPPDIIIMERGPRHLTESFSNLRDPWQAVPHLNTWHHEAHFASVLSEHGLMPSNEAIMGVVWDRGGYGADGQQWGSEFMIRQDGRIQQILAFDDLPFADPESAKTGHRIAALGLLRHRLDARRLIGHLFSREEWSRYERWAMRGTDTRTRSMSHIIDGVAAILGLSEEGCDGYSLNGLPLIETIARSIQMDISQPYELIVRHGKVDWRYMIDMIIGDLDSGAGREMIARRFMVTLANLIAQIASDAGVKKVALSGDVFISPLLVSMITEALGRHFTLYIHQFMAPTDECVNLGQLALWADGKRRSQSPGADARSSVRGRSERSE
jgi:hydrogenase maturation protein HypF